MRQKKIVRFHVFSSQFVYRAADWLVGWLIGWLVGWLMDAAGWTCCHNRYLLPNPLVVQAINSISGMITGGGIVSVQLGKSEYQ